MTEFQQKLESLINETSQENASDTPDWILAEYLNHCLDAFNVAVTHREQYYGAKSPDITIQSGIVNDPKEDP
jgi:hypothetical protein